MKKIGCFRRDGQEFIGTITWLQSDFKARIAPVKHKPAPTSPDYMVTKLGSDEFAAELGGAWQKHSKEQNIPFLDVVLDNPALQHAINAVLCEGDDNLWYLYWDRVNAGEEMIQTLYVEENCKPQLGFRPIANLTLNILRFYPELVPGS